MNDVILSPCSNSSIRDWPVSHYARLAGLLLEGSIGCRMVRVTGTASQRLRANEIVREQSPARVANDCGRLSWNELTKVLAGAACVIGNNSGIAHLGAYLGAPTVCIFGGSHQRLEWRPRGDRTIVLSRAIACSPCHLDHTRVSPYDKACLRDITPEEVLAAVIMVMRPSGLSSVTA